MWRLEEEEIVNSEIPSAVKCLLLKEKWSRETIDHRKDEHDAAVRFIKEKGMLDEFIKFLEQLS